MHGEGARQERERSIRALGDVELVAGRSRGRWCGLARSHGLPHCDRGRCLSKQLAGGGAAGLGGLGAGEEGQASRGCSGGLTSCKPWSQARALSPWTQMSGRELDVLARGRLMSLQGRRIRGPGPLPGTAHMVLPPQRWLSWCPGAPPAPGSGVVHMVPDAEALLGRRGECRKAPLAAEVYPRRRFGQFRSLPAMLLLIIGGDFTVNERLSPASPPLTSFT